VGDLRWREARIPTTNRTVVAADAFGSACPAVLPPGAPFQPGGSEDCLFLNVWAPEKAWKLPVMVWIHGGGYGLGDGTQDMVELINSNNHSFVVVSIQYRVSRVCFLDRGHWKQGTTDIVDTSSVRLASSLPRTLTRMAR
jgi:carboxylesterase type B